MSFPRYEHYRQCNLSWCPALPAHWDTRKLKFLFELQKREPADDDRIITAFRDGQVTLRDLRRTEGFTNSLKEIGYQGVKKGDLVIHAMDGFAGAIGISEHDGKSTPVYSVCTAKPGTNAYYYAKLLRYMAISGFVASLAKGVRERSSEFRWADAGPLYLPLPPLPEQAAIVAFLDHETAKIDALVEEQQRLIELLKEKRQAVISHAVTKGLNPDAPMKDSGVVSLGEVPEHWELMAIKRIVSLQSGEAITSENIEETGTYPVYGGNGQRGYTEAFTHEGDFVLIGRQGALCGNINYADGRFWASEHAVVATSRRPLVTRWLGALLTTMNLNQYSLSAAQPGLSVEAIGKLSIPVPPLEEQDAIAAHIGRLQASSDELIYHAQAAISLLQERRSALISAAVTGKIDVRGLVCVEAEAA